MKRRQFITLLGGAAATWPVAARGQGASGRVARIAYLGALSPTILDPRQIEQFNVGLVENGLIEGRNITVDYVWAEGSPERLQQLAAELARRDLDVIVTAGPQAVHALMDTQTKTPIVFAIVPRERPDDVSSYGDVAGQRQAEIIRALRGSGQAAGL